MAKPLEIVFTAKARKHLAEVQKGNAKAAQQLGDALITYATSRQGSVKALRDSGDCEIRLRVRMWRVIVYVDEKRKRLIVVDVGKRADIYRRWGRR